MTTVKPFLIDCFFHQVLNLVVVGGQSLFEFSSTLFKFFQSRRVWFSKRDHLFNSGDVLVDLLVGFVEIDQTVTLEGEELSFLIQVGFEDLTECLNTKELVTRLTEIFIALK